MKLKHIIFDLDGTVIDTEKSLSYAWRDALKAYGYDFTAEEAAYAIGVTTEKGLERLNAKVDENFMSVWHEKYKLYANNIEYFENMKEALLKLKDSGYILGAVSSRNKKEYKDFLSNLGLEKFFDIIVLSEDTKNHKPHPEPLYKYMEITNANKEECIYIGDATTDVECANNAGITSGFVKWNNSKIETEEADVRFNTLRELLEYLNVSY